MAETTPGYRNGHVTIPLTGARACSDGKAGYIAIVYHAPNRLLRQDMIVPNRVTGDYTELVDYVNNRLNEDRRPARRRASAAAVVLTRFCTNVHEDERQPSLFGHRMEIVDSLVAADADSPVVPMRSRFTPGPDSTVRTNGSDQERQYYPLVLPVWEDAPVPEQMVAVTQGENKYFYVALHGTVEHLIGAPVHAA
jgi:hypothetical protein